MSNTREKLKKIRSAIRASHKDIMNIELIRAELIDWLSQISFPAYPNAASWEECIVTYPEKNDKKVPPGDGIKLRLSLKLYTTQHHYLLSIIECFNPDASKVGILTIHVNWDEKEYNIQKSIETSYKQQFEDSLHARQTIWAQSFYFTEFCEALNSCALAILGNELLGSSEDKNRQTIKHPPSIKTSFPKSE